MNTDRCFCLWILWRPENMVTNIESATTESVDNDVAYLTPPASNTIFSDKSRGSSLEKSYSSNYQQSRNCLVSILKTMFIRNTSMLCLKRHIFAYLIFRVMLCTPLQMYACNHEVSFKTRQLTTKESFDLDFAREKIFRSLFFNKNKLPLLYTTFRCYLIK